MEILRNPLRGQGIQQTEEMSLQQVSVDAAKVMDLLKHCPVAKQTPLHIFNNTSASAAQTTHGTSLALADDLDIRQLYIKDERDRMGLGSFKALGAAYVIALAAANKIDASDDVSRETISAEQLSQTLNGQTYVCASAGNHGLSVAAGARVFGAKAVIYLSETVPESFAARLRDYGAEVVRAGENYEASMTAAAAKAEESDWILLSDSSWPGYTELPTQVMEGYLVVPAETCQQLENQEPPTHIFLQAGVGGIAAAATAYFRQYWGDEPTIVIAEPSAAPAIIGSVVAGKPFISKGPVSNMGRLDCKEPSHIALACLAREADFFVTLSDAEVQETTDWLAARGIESTPSATAGLSVVQQSITDESIRAELGITKSSRVLVLITEQA